MAVFPRYVAGFFQNLVLFSFYVGTNGEFKIFELKDDRKVRACRRRPIDFRVIDLLQGVVSTLPDLFMCSSLGDGFGALVVSLHYALTNPSDEMITLDQLLEVRLGFRDIRERPFLKHQEAIERIIKIESSGLVVDPIVDFLPSASENGSEPAT